VPAVLAAVGIGELGPGWRKGTDGECTRRSTGGGGSGSGGRGGRRRRLSLGRLLAAAERIVEGDASRAQRARVDGHLVKRARAKEGRFEAGHNLEGTIAEPLVAGVRLSGITVWLRVRHRCAV